ncbi:hypothetical protein PI126_g9603 [Phytophthora idaei]|nr:hypothetical protein PI126_g9603 [Phytophthora idaei]
MEPDTPPTTNVATVTAAKLSERKRLKHREYVKKSYKKKLTTLANLRRELEMLDKQYASILLSESSNNQQSDEDSSTGAQTPTMQKYLQATDLKKWYQQENGRLYQLNAYHMKVESRMGQLLDAYEAARVPLPRVSSARQYRIRPLPTATYTKLVNEATNDVLRFARSPEKLSTGARVLGWMDQREVQGRTLKFALQKEFGLSPRDLLHRSWEIFSNPDEFSKIYGSALDIEEGFLLLFRSIDKDLVHFEEVDVGGVPEVRMNAPAALKIESSEMWVEKYIWVLFYNVPNEPKKCLFHFGGTATTQLWLREVLFVAVRWESMAVGSQFTLTAE